MIHVTLMLFDKKNHKRIHIPIIFTYVVRAILTKKKQNKTNEEWYLFGSGLLDIFDLKIKVPYYRDQEMRLLSMAINP